MLFASERLEAVPDPGGVVSRGYQNQRFVTATRDDSRYVPRLGERPEHPPPDGDGFDIISIDAEPLQPTDRPFVEGEIPPRLGIVGHQDLTVINEYSTRDVVTVKVGCGDQPPGQIFGRPAQYIDQAVLWIAWTGSFRRREGFELDQLPPQYSLRPLHPRKGRSADQEPERGADQQGDTDQEESLVGSGGFNHFWLSAPKSPRGGGLFRWRPAVSRNR